LIAASQRKQDDDSGEGEADEGGDQVVTVGSEDDVALVKN
jgi:hypothetical protein